MFACVCVCACKWCATSAAAALAEARASAHLCSRVFGMLAGWLGLLLTDLLTAAISKASAAAAAVWELRVWMLIAYAMFAARAYYMM